MRKIVTIMLLLSTIGMMECSKKNSELPKPVEPIKPLTPVDPRFVMIAEVDGEPLQVDSTLSEALLLPYKPDNILTDKKTDYLILSFQAKPGEEALTVLIFDFKMKPGKVAYPVADNYYLDDHTGIDYSSPTRTSYSSTSCATRDWVIDITAFDQVKKRVKGTFSGTVCAGEKKSRITQGNFNLPYIVK